MWISPKTLCSPVLASFADSKLLDFARASDSMAKRINRLCAMYGMYVHQLSAHVRLRQSRRSDRGMTVASFQL